ncbi:hypothetical protein VNO77_19595 [Canavalia gladiata]|uniref:Uncharacterized protein n=1 Tax=Canavalia gladiata TaxID=3824 RepID=A0AAN9QLK4_CANGL
MGEEKQYKGILRLTPTAKHILEQGMDGSFNIVCASPSATFLDYFLVLPSFPAQATATEASGYPNARKSLRSL